MTPRTTVGKYTGNWNYSVSPNGFMTSEIFLDKVFYIYISIYIFIYIFIFIYYILYNFLVSKIIMILSFDLLGTTKST